VGPCPNIVTDKFGVLIVTGVTQSQCDSRVFKSIGFTAIYISILSSAMTNLLFIG